MWFVEQLNLDYLACAEGTLSTHWQGIPQSDTHTHIHIAQRHTHTVQCSPLACDFSSRTLSPVWWCHQGLMRDYSDITGTAAKLNLLVSPCACSALRLELCVCVCVRVSIISCAILRKLCSSWVSAFSYHPSILLSISVHLWRWSLSAMSNTKCGGHQS